MSTGNSIAVWIENNEFKSKKCKIDLHANLWRDRDKKGVGNYFLDLGLLFDSSEQEQYICTFFPIKVDSSKDLSDLGVYFKDVELANAVFNEYIQVHSSADLWVTVEKPEERIKVRIIEAEDMSIQSNYGGSVLKIKVPALSNHDSKIYIRFRIKNIVNDMFIQTYQPRDSFSRSSFQKVETVDFRVNEKRNIPKRLSEDIKEWPSFNKTHLLCLVHSEDGLIFSDKQVYASRSIEHKIWDKYLTTYEFINMIAYHWKIKNKSEINALIKFQTHSNNKKTIAKYLLYVVLISLFTNFVYDGIKLSVQSISQSIHHERVQSNDK